MRSSFRLFISDHKLGERVRPSLPALVKADRKVKTDVGSIPLWKRARLRQHTCAGVSCPWVRGSLYETRLISQYLGRAELVHIIDRILTAE